MMESLSIDGLKVAVVKPASVAEVCDIVKQQRAKKEAVYPVGGRTMLDFGLPPTKPGVALDVTGVNQVTDYPARDMTITVQAGITFAKLQAVLAKENQWLPLDVPDPERMTLGGLIACNVSGPRRYGYGTLRDYVIGIEFASDDGSVIHGGGRVVKNVAGYDLMKLHIGALGTMGVITQVTLKVRPRPEGCSIILLECPIDRAEILLDLTSKTRSRPSAVQFTQAGHLVVQVGFEEKDSTRKSQLATLQNEADAAGLKRASEITDNPNSISETSLSKGDPNELFLYQIISSPSKLVGFLQQLRRHTITGQFLNGVAWMRSTEEVNLGLHQVVAYRAPPSWKTPERVFGKPTPAFELMRHIKRTLDPEDVFNPGRMF